MPAPTRCWSIGCSEPSYRQCKPATRIAGPHRERGRRAHGYPGPAWKLLTSCLCALPGPRQARGAAVREPWGLVSAPGPVQGLLRSLPSKCQEHTVPVLGHVEEGPGRCLQAACGSAARCGRRCRRAMGECSALGGVQSAAATLALAWYRRRMRRPGRVSADSVHSGLLARWRSAKR
jgi:hypothetical protein